MAGQGNVQQPKGAKCFGANINHHEIVPEQDFSNLTAAGDVLILKDRRRFGTRLQFAELPPKVFLELRQPFLGRKEEFSHGRKSVME